MKNKLFVVFVLLVLLNCSFYSHASAWKQPFTLALKNGGAYVVDDKGQVLFSHRENDSFIPASTIKMATAAMALKQLGENFRFSTTFYLAPNKKLVLVGEGDPFLTSEELAVMASHLKKQGLKKMSGLILDTTYFDPNLVIDGSSSTDNPYDAANGALLANFNTVYVQKLKDGRVISAEEQTPMTNIAKEAGKNIQVGKKRVNLGKDRVKGALYAGELLIEFLKSEGVQVEGGVELGPLPLQSQFFYEHVSSKTLKDIVQNLLKYSTNFMANQLFLVAGAKEYGAPATMEKGKKVLTEFLSTEVGWQNFEIYEGAGLSRKNRVTPKQMVELAQYCKPYRELLDERDGIFFAKTGTLNGVNTYAGFVSLGANQWGTFAIMVNDQVPFDYKFQLAKMMYEGIHQK